MANRAEELRNQIESAQRELAILEGDVWIDKTANAQHKFYQIDDAIYATFELCHPHSLKCWFLKHHSCRGQRTAIHWPSFGDVAKEIPRDEFLRIATLYLDRELHYLDLSRTEAERIAKEEEK